MNNRKTDISIVIPCCNEAGNILALYSQLTALLSTIIPNYECIFVDDGSTDNTLAEIKSLCESHPPIKYISFSRNFGHQKALRAGLDASSGDAVITMDADLQHPVRLIPSLIDHWRAGVDIVNTMRTDAGTTGIFKRMTSALFYHVMNFLTGQDIKKGSADFRLMDRKVVDILCRNKEDDLFLRGMIGWCGFRQTVIDYTADERHSGKTKYSLCKMMKLAVDGITSFTIKPLRLAIVLSAVFALLGCIETGYVVYVACFTEKAVSGWSSLAILISIQGAAVLLMLGIIGEYVGRTFMQGKRRPVYIVSETNCDDSPYLFSSNNIFIEKNK